MPFAPRTRRAAAALLAAAAALTFTWVAARGPHATGSTPFAFQYRWPTGTEYRYHFHWTSQQRGRSPLPGAPELTAGVDLEGDLVVRAIAQRDGAAQLALSFDRLQRVEGSIQGQPMALAPEGLGGRVAVAEVGPDGAVRAFRYRPEDPASFKTLASGVLLQGMFPLPADGSLEQTGRWTATERGELGIVRAELVATDDAPPTIARTRTAYEQFDLVPSAPAPAHRLDSTAVLTLSPEGHVRAVRAHEAVDLDEGPGGTLLHATSTFELTLTGAGRFDAAAVEVAGLSEVHARGARPAADPARERQMLQLRAGGMTMDSLEDDLLTRVVGGRLPDMNAWFDRAIGVLRLNPERCAELAPLFARPELAPQTRALILDLLAAAGHPQAQAVLRELIDSPAARRSQDEQVALVQRLSLVKAPVADTLRFAIDHHRDERGPVKSAAAYALGSVLGRSGELDPALVGEARRALLEPLRAARTREDRVTLLRAIGNAGLAEAQPELLAAARSDDLEVRLAAAAGMRKVRSPECTAALLQLAGDRYGFVQVAALDGLRGRDLGAAELEALARLAAGAGLSDEASAVLVSLLDERGPIDPGARQVLASLLARGIGEAGLRARVQQLLARPS
ncbi:MAG TPA: HEAT repeat domain-containing protein [Myxococcaceae bacterium]|jgi:hypothetical protein